MAKFLNINHFAPTALLRFQLRQRMLKLRNIVDDKLEEFGTFESRLHELLYLEEAPIKYFGSEFAAWPRPAATKTGWCAALHRPRRLVG